MYKVLSNRLGNTAECQIMMQGMRAETMEEVGSLNGVAIGREVDLDFSG